MRGAYFQYYYNCKIRSRNNENKDGTFVVDYEDGDKDPNVEWQNIVLQRIVFKGIADKNDMMTGMWPRHGEQIQL